MGSTNTTKYYGFPQYGFKDHPDFLNEINKAYEKMDYELHRLREDIESINEKLKIINNGGN